MRDRSDAVYRARIGAKLSRQAVGTNDVRERFAALGVEPHSRAADEMARYLRSEVEKYAKIVKAIGLKID